MDETCNERCAELLLLCLMGGAVNRRHAFARAVQFGNSARYNSDDRATISIRKGSRAAFPPAGVVDRHSRCPRRPGGYDVLEV